MHHTSLFQRCSHSLPNQCLFVVEQRRDGLKCNIGSGGGGEWRYTDTGGDRYVYYSKRGRFMEVPQHLSLILVTRKLLLVSILRVRLFSNRTLFHLSSTV